MISRHSLLSRCSSYHTLLALCVVFIIYEFYTLRATRSAHIEEAAASRHSEISKILWYKLGPHGLTDDTRRWTNTCINNNPSYHAKFMTDDSGDEFVRKTFASRPDIVDNYLALSVPIFKADILRYLLLFDQGGIWSDLDVSCDGIPIDEWVPAEYKDNAELVVGWEFDSGWEGEYVRQFASWTIMAKPKSPHMMQVIDDIFQTLREKTIEKNLAVENATVVLLGDVVDFSGPRRLTRSIYTSLSKMLNRTVGAAEMQEILQPKLVGNVLVMPGRSFASSANRYTPEEEKLLPPSLVTHHYAGTWKNDHGGER